LLSPFVHEMAADEAMLDYSPASVLCVDRESLYIFIRLTENSGGHSVCEAMVPAGLCLVILKSLGDLDMRDCK
jgi:hypothetical protein